MLPTAAQHRLKHADADTLLRWTERVLTAPSLDEVMRGVMNGLSLISQPSSRYVMTYRIRVLENAQEDLDWLRKSVRPVRRASSR